MPNSIFSRKNCFTKWNIQLGLLTGLLCLYEPKDLFTMLKTCYIKDELKWMKDAPKVWMKDELKSVWMCGVAAVGQSRWSHNVHWNNTTETVIDLWQCGHLAAQLPQVTIKSSFLHWMHNLWTVPYHSCTLIVYRYISFHFQPYRDVI